PSGELSSTPTSALSSKPPAAVPSEPSKQSVLPSPEHLWCSQHSRREVSNYSLQAGSHRSASLIYGISQSPPARCLRLPYFKHKTHYEGDDGVHLSFLAKFIERGANRACR